MDLLERCKQIQGSYDTVDFEKIKKIFPRADEIITRLEKIQNHTYSNRKVALASLVHRSALVYWPMDKTGVHTNERLEFLGDAYLSFFVATEAMIAHSDLQEGALSKLRAALVGTQYLSQKAKEIGLGELLFLGKGEISSMGQVKANALADAFESVTAALLLDGGDRAARNWLSSIYAADLMIGKETLVQFDVKTQFQQWTQAIVGTPPTYRVVGTVGTPQETQFIVAAFIGDTELARASALNKREASKIVASRMQKMVDDGELTADKIRQYYESKK